MDDYKKYLAYATLNQIIWEQDIVTISPDYCTDLFDVLLENKSSGCNDSTKQSLQLCDRVVDLGLLFFL